MLLHGDDLPDGFKPDEWRWVEYRVRMLVPKNPMRATFEAEHEASLTCDETSRAQIGKPGTCSRCGLVTIDAHGFPWGHHYRQAFGERPGPYCPHCTGGEDVD